MRLNKNGWKNRIQQATSRKELYAIINDAYATLTEKSVNKIIEMCENRERQLGILPREFDHTVAEPREV